jgi:DNA-3-methyladenine glycosylase II
MNTTISTFTEGDFNAHCDLVAATDGHLKAIIDNHGYPPFWSRTPGFATMVHIILEQQVSLASAKAAFLKLQEKIGHITPSKVLQLTDEELKACYFSRQKIAYTKHLATEVNCSRLDLGALAGMENDSIRAALKQLKGVGDWTVDVFLMMALHRTDVFPQGDIALLKSIKEVKGLPADTPKAALLQLADTWKPYRTVAAYLLWHAYLERRKPKSKKL